MFARTIVAILIACAVLIAAFFASAWRAAIDPISPPDPGSFDQALVRRGAQLAALAHC
jgi:hypothetical protein